MFHQYSVIPAALFCFSLLFTVAMLKLYFQKSNPDKQLLLHKMRLEAMLSLHSMRNSSIEEITGVAIEKSLEITESKVGYLAFLDESESMLKMHSWSISAMKECQIEDKPLMYKISETGLWGESVVQRRPIITNDYSAVNSLKKGYPEGHVEIKRHLGVPIFDGDKIVALIGVGNKEEEYDENDINQLNLLISEMWVLIGRLKAQNALIESNEKIKLLNEELEQKVFERTSKLNEALKQVEDANVEFRVLNQSIAEESLKLLNLNDVLATKEQELIVLNKELEKRVFMRTQELNDAMQRLEEAGKFNTIVLSNLGHELRTPLNGILGFTNILITDIKDPDHLDCLSAIKSSGDRLRNTLNSLLVLTELETGQTKLYFENVDLVDYAKHYNYTMEETITSENLKFNLEIKKDQVDVYISEYLLTQILFNLIDNAIKFTQQGSITMEVDKITEKGIDYGVLSVIDTGSGITAEKISSIFEPFRQVSEGIARTHEGVGLGLTITRKMVELMNGQIKVESEINQGSKFSLLFKLNRRQ